MKTEKKQTNVKEINKEINEKESKRMDCLKYKIEG